MINCGMRLVTTNLTYKEVQPKLLMCVRHCYMVPFPLRASVWYEYRAGQEIDKMPSDAYLLAMRDAINAVAKIEGQPLLPDIYTPMRDS